MLSCRFGPPVVAILSRLSRRRSLANVYASGSRARSCSSSKGGRRRARRERGRNGLAGALRAPIASEQDRGPDFLRLSNALPALYPRGAREKRLLDAMLPAAPR